MRRMLSRVSWSRWLSVFFAVLVAVLAWDVASDEPAPPDRPYRVPMAVVDITKVFNRCKSFAKEMDDLKTQVDEHERQMAVKQKEIAESLSKDAGSAPGGDKTSQAEEAAKRIATEMYNQRQEFLAFETRAYVRTFAEIEKITAQIAKQRDIGVVMRSEFGELNPANRESVRQGVNRAVIYAAVPDITEDVISALNGDES